MRNNGKSWIQLKTTASPNHTNNTALILQGSGNAMKALLEQANCPSGEYELRLNDNSEQHGRGIRPIRLNLEKNQVELTVQFNNNNRNSRHGLLFCPEGKSVEIWARLYTAHHDFSISCLPMNGHAPIDESGNIGFEMLKAISVVNPTGHFIMGYNRIDNSIHSDPAQGKIAFVYLEKDTEANTVYANFLMKFEGKAYAIFIVKATKDNKSYLPWEKEAETLIASLLQTPLFETGVVDETGKYHPTPKKPLSPESALAIAEELFKIGQFPIVIDTKAARQIVKGVATKSGEDIDYKDCFYSKNDNSLCHPTEHLCNLLLKLPEEGKSKEILSDAFNHLKQQEARLLQKIESLCKLKSEQEHDIGKIEKEEREIEAQIAALQQRQTNLSEEKRQARQVFQQASADLAQATDQVDKIKEIYTHSECQLVADRFGFKLPSPT